MSPASGPAIVVHALWILTEDAPHLAETAVPRLASYITRWAKTLGVKVWAVGGAGNHLHLVLDLPFDRAVQAINDELQTAVTRYAREILGLPHVTWQAVPLFAGVSWHEKDALVSYVRENAQHHTDETASGDWEMHCFNGQSHYTEEAYLKYIKSIDDSRRNDDTGSPNEMPLWLRDAISASKSPL